MLWSLSLLSSLYHERAVRNKGQIENAEDDSVCSKLLTRISRTFMLNRVNIARVING